jgi:GNAT superfamily N-acetyltransferase
METDSVRLATRADLPAILVLYAQLNDEAPISLSQARRLFRQAGQRGQVYFVAERGGLVAGTCNLTIVPNLTRGGRPYAVIENVVVDSSLRGAGLGKALMEAAVGRARDSGCYKVLLLSSAKRVEAHAFYQAIGFDGDSKRGFELRF